MPLATSASDEPAGHDSMDDGGGLDFRSSPETEILFPVVTGDALGPSPACRPRPSPGRVCSYHLRVREEAVLGNEVGAEP